MLGLLGLFGLAGGLLGRAGHEVGQEEAAWLLGPDDLAGPWKEVRPAWAGRISWPSWLGGRPD
ncbi:hypothetical protein E2562_026934 [Oryza meyeriana var. granulata]|uniref:Uncharacterized protein n=1 Tax=Oryza meyeriana var. granulata TaxID=110450 RepID=A0A6G1EZ68_9ORYZ|nr:hypothetical protein E2562_026934 [Oryza meyeriana var. granulata]